MLQKQWSGIVWPTSDQAEKHPETSIDADTLRKVGKASVSYGEGFVCAMEVVQLYHSNAIQIQEIHPRLSRHVSNRLKSLESGKNIDWATAEVPTIYPQWNHALSLHTIFTGSRFRNTHAGRMRCADIRTRCWSRDVQSEVRVSSSGFSR